MKERPHTRSEKTQFSRKQWFIALSTIVLAFVVGGALVILPQSFGASAANPPSILVIPKSTSYSQQKNIRVGGSHFAPNESVSVYFNYTGPGTGTLEQTLNASTTGQFLSVFGVPLVATGTYTIAAIQQPSGDVATGTTQILPQLYMSPRAAGPGTLGYFYGNAFGNGESVNIYWSSINQANLLATPTANATGSFQTTATIPAGQVGQVPVYAVGQTTQTSASTTFIVYKPTLALAPVSGPPGTQLTASAVGYQAFEKVNFYWNGSTTPFASPATNPYGYTGIFPFTVPAGTVPGTYTIQGVGSKSKISITSTFTAVAPSSSLSSTTGPVGTSVTVTGAGYAPGETVNVQWNYSGPGTGTTVATTTANAYSGVFTASFNVPTATTGSYPIAVAGATSSSVTTSSFTIANSLALSPASTPPGTNTTVTGTGFQAGETVQMFLDSTSGTQLTSAIADSNGNINAPATLPAFVTPGAHTIIGVGQISALSFSAPLTINTNWGDFGFDTVHSRDNPYENSLSVNNVSGLTLKWPTAPFTALGLRSSPAYANGIIYIGTHDGMLIGFNATTGVQVLKFKPVLTFEVPSAPLADPANNLVFFGTMGFEDSGIPSPFYAVNATTGKLVWSVIMPWNNFGFPSLHFNTIFIGSSHEGGSAYLNAIDELSGHINWQYVTNGGVWGSVAADSPNGVNTVFTGVGNPSNYVLSLNASTGQLNWFYAVPNSPADDDVGSGIAVSNGLVYASSKNGNFYAVNESTGAFVWSQAIGTTDIGNVSSPAVGPDGTIYAGSFDKHLYALSPSGSILWTIQTNGLIDGSPAVANGVVYFSSNDDSIYAANASTGAILWHYNTGRLSHSSPIVVNGWLYATSSNGAVYGFSL